MKQIQNNALKFRSLRSYKIGFNYILTKCACVCIVYAILQIMMVNSSLIDICDITNSQCIEKQFSKDINLHRNFK